MADARVIDGPLTLDDRRLLVELQSFGVRWMLTEIERTGIGGDRVFFGSDEPWSDFDSEYWKINGIRGISQELKERVFWQNYEEAFGTNA